MSFWNFQRRAYEWASHALGHRGGADHLPERNVRFLEEALELVQSTGLTKEDALRLVDYVYSRDAGLTAQEIGGVIVTLSVLCQVLGLDALECGEIELNRCWKNVEKIREKQLNKGIRYEAAE